MTDGAFLSVTCSGCGARSDRVPARLAGKRIKCSACGVTLTAPAVPPPAAGRDAPTVLEAPAGAPPSEKPAAPAGEPAATVLESDEAGATILEDDEPAATQLEDGAARPTVAEDGAVAPTARESAPPPIAPRPSAPPEGATGVDWKTGEVVLGLYEVLGVLGQGGMGRVYRVRHRGWGLDLAVKAPLPEMLAAVGGADLFEKEAETWVNLGLHPHVVTCYYVRRAFGQPLVFAELADGGSLLDVIRERRLQTADAILDVAIQAAWGLHYAHEQGLVHRDVKPANVLITSDGTAKVTDFGLARGQKRQARGPRLDPGAKGGGTMTVEGGGGGTPAYLSPEQATGNPLTRRSDLWSFALSLLEIFAGGRTWEHGLAAPEVLAEYRAGGLAPDGVPPMPDPVAGFLEQCFREQPDERPRSMAEAAGVLKDAWEATTGRPYPRREPKGGRGSADGMNNRGVSLVDLGRRVEAATLWRRALETEPQHVEATYNGSLAEWSAGRLGDDELVRRMDEVVTSHAGNPRAHQLRGRVLLQVGQGAEAQAAFARAAEAQAASGQSADLGGATDLDRDVRAAAVPPREPGLTLRGLRGRVSALALTPDGNTVVAACENEARVWDAASGTLLKTLSVPDGAIHALATLPDGRFLIVGAENAPLTLWDLLTAQPARTWTRHPGHVTCLALVPGGKLVVSGGSDRLVRLWDASSGTCVHEMAGHDDAVTAVAAGPTRLASASRDGSVRLWALEDGRLLGALRGHEGRVGAVALSEEDSRVVSAGEDRSVRDWGLNSRELVRAYVSHAGAVHALALAPRGTGVVSGAADRTVRSWDPDSERLTEWQQLDAAVHLLSHSSQGMLWAAHGSAVSRLEAAPLVLPPPALCRPSSAIEVEARAESFEERIDEARRTLAAGDFTLAASLVKTARSIPGHERSGPALALWDDLCARLPRRALQSAWEEGALSGHTDTPVAAACSPDGSRAVTASLDASLRVWDLSTRKGLSTITGHDGAVSSVAYLGRGDRVVSGGRDRTLRIWDLNEARLLRTLEGHGETVSSVDSSPDGTRIVSASWDGTVRLWDLRGGSIDAQVLEGHEAQVTAVRFAQDGRAVASAGFDGTVRIWDADDGEELCVLDRHDGNVTAVALHPTSRSLASGTEAGTVRLWDPRARRAMRTLKGHQGEVSHLVFSPDGRFLLSSGRDHTVRLWDLRRGIEARALQHPEAVHAVALTPVANLLLAAVGDGTLRLWHLDWEPEETAPGDWEENARPFLESYVSRVRGATVGPTARVTVSDADLNGLLADLHRRGFGGLTAETVRPRLEKLASAPDDAPSYWETLRRHAPAVARAVPRAATAVKRFPWGRAILGTVLAAAFVIGVLSWRTPEAKVALSPHMAETVPGEIDLIDLEPFSEGCDPQAYEGHLDALFSGNPSAGNVACVAALSDGQTAHEVLDGAPLTDDDGLVAHRYRRNAASALAGIQPTALDALCDRLGDVSRDVRGVAALALAGRADDEGVLCVEDVLAGGPPLARDAAVLPFRHYLARGLIGPDAGWALLLGLLQDPDPEARIAGLRSASMYTARVSEPVVRPLLDDPDPAVAEAAEKALGSIQAVLRADLLQGNVRPD